jgi:hypothetical protein
VYQQWDIRNERFPMTIDYDHRTDTRFYEWRTGIPGMTIWLKHCLEENGKEWRTAGATFMENATHRRDVGSKWQMWMERISQEQRLKCELLPFWGSHHPVNRNGQLAISYT